jgi:hypothetical protein
MTTTIQHLLDAFDLLYAAEQQAVACKILRRMQDVDLPPLTDEELILIAEALFLELDRREAMDAYDTAG